MSLEILVPPAAEPITLAEAKAQLRLDADITADDALISYLITVVRSACEQRTGRRLITQDLRYRLHTLPRDGLRLTTAPVVEMLAIAYLDPAGTDQSLPLDQCALVPDGQTALLLPAWGATWPATADRPGAVRIDYRAGYGATGANVPADLRHWMLVMLSTLYAQREGVAAGNLGELPRSYVDGLLDPYILYGVA